MGQQQLLLLVLGIVIVGLAVVVGIQAFSENQKKSNADALVNDAIRIASDADYENLNGVFELADDGADLTITATSYESDGTTSMTTSRSIRSAQVRQSQKLILLYQA